VYLRTIFVFCFSLLSLPCCAQFGKQFYFMQFSVDLSATGLKITTGPGKQIHTVKKPVLVLILLLKEKLLILLILQNK